ncbi:MAG: ATP synthase F1 subunit gamma [Bacteroidales bacterium]|nr:ATP synthase F1 subunit gamma [Bacteroidales bacterium]
MANLKEIRNRIASVTSTRQITSAMKMVSAAKLRKSQSAIIQLRPYVKMMSEITLRLLHTDRDVPFLRSNKGEEKILLLVLTSNKGLCSVFNSSIVKLAKKRINECSKEGKKIFVKSFGKRGDSSLKAIEGIEYLGSDDGIWDSLNFDNVSSIAEELVREYQTESYDRIEIIYNQFKNAAVQEPVVQTFLPFNLESNSHQKELKAENNYIFEPNKERILQSVIPLYLNTLLYKCFLDSFTSEHGARMSSMNKATDNAQELLNDLTLTYNKLRQAGITNEIIEICGGANALS